MVDSVHQGHFFLTNLLCPLGWGGNVHFGLTLHLLSQCVYSVTSEQQGDILGEE